MDINQANIDNLTRLWKKYGVQIIDKNTQLIKNTSWPYRCWFDLPASGQNYLQLKHLDTTAIVPMWSEPENADIEEKENSNLSSQLFLTKQSSLEVELVKKGQCLFSQTAMYLAILPAVLFTIKDKIKLRKGFTVKLVTKTQELMAWVDIASKAFGYVIDQSVIESLMNDSEIRLLLAYDNDEAIATALMYKTGSIIGVHQVGVKPDVQGKGFSRLLMSELIVNCAEWQGTHVVLQASDAGKPLYDKLGFQAQFLINNYQRV
ncbi:GNAT family N-acetyltransferase [Colwellia sp. MSW7]|uniref:GNAT family N-acetyltransferase n=1 Tax=Colwellia maritima TaxID=2912588 RepID=A0ABS9X3H7_9GAMM|nr:GNAT family N-acetyltransferase [Colwellia maritima]MCI2284724.1 GNAT family N-acetyltransferase [Colwellia maritima]